MDLRTGTLTGKAAKKLRFTGQLAQVLKVLMETPTVVHRSRLLNVIDRGRANGVGPKLLDVYICHLRKRLRECNADVQIITLPLIGYQMVAEVPTKEVSLPLAAMPALQELAKQAGRKDLVEVLQTAML